MKKLILIALLTLQSLAAHAHILLGGVGSGGGGSLPVNPVSPFMVESIAKDSKIFLRLLFNQLEAQGSLNDQPAIRAKLFGGGQTIHDFIKNYGIFFAVDKPCFDSAGEPRDGSIFAPEPNKICISPFSIAQKIPASEAFPQIIALIAHEYSHLVGTDENEAVYLQTILEISIKGPWDGIDENKAALISQDIHLNFDAIYDMRRSIDNLITNLDSLNADERSLAINQVLEQFSSFRDASFNQYPLAIFPGAGQVIANGFNARILSVLWKLRGDSTAGDALNWEKAYQGIFQNDQKIDLKTWNERHFNKESSAINPPGFILRKINDKATLRQELQELKSEASVLTQLANETVFKNKP